MSNKYGFTLIELLIVIAVVAILSVVVILALNPAELLKQSRDSNRISDMDTVNRALSLFQVDNPGGSFGTASTTYISYPDSSSSCANLGISTSTLPSGWTYGCAPISTYAKTNGTGWVPVNLSNISSGSPLSKLPVDPTNTTSTNNYYTYVGNSSNWALSTLLESSKYLSQTAGKDGGYDPGRYEKGSSLAMIGQAEGLQGWWGMDEGNGTTAGDSSGNGNSGTWAGSTPYWTNGKIGGAGLFDGSTDRVSIPDSASLRPAALTVTSWVNISNTTCSTQCYIFSKYGGNYHGVLLWITPGGIPSMQILSSTSSQPSISGGSVQVGQWAYVAGTWDGSTMSLFVNGANVANTSATSITWDTGQAGMIGGTSWFTNYNFPGSIDDVRFYGRALTAAEIQVIYNATK